MIMHPTSIKVHYIFVLILSREYEYKFQTHQSCKCVQPLIIFKCLYISSIIVSVKRKKKISETQLETYVCHEIFLQN